jgi:hypothetical protein
VSAASSNSVANTMGGSHDVSVLAQQVHGRWPHQLKHHPAALVIAMPLQLRSPAVVDTET